MTVSRSNEHTLRPAGQLLAWAFGISLATHLLLYGGFLTGQHFGWWKKDLLPFWLKSTKQTLAEIKKSQQNHPAQPQQQQEPPLLFVEVDPAVATKEAPKKPTHYSSQNSQAANPDVKIDSQVPNLTGTQNHVPKTQDTARSHAVPLRPAAPKPSTTLGSADTESKAKPKGGPAVGDLVMAKPAHKPSESHVEEDKGDAKTSAHQRPHSLAEAKLQQELAMPGQKMKQDGGVQRHLKVSSLDAINSPFGEYDRELIDNIRSHWYQLLERISFAQDRTGMVVVEFTLSHNGRILDLHVQQSNVDDVLTYACERAIREPAPFLAWPPDMRRIIGADTRDVTFTFYYE